MYMWHHDSCITEVKINNYYIKDPISHICLAGAVVASWSLTEEAA